MTVQEAHIRKLDSQLQAKMAKLSLDGARFELDESTTSSAGVRWKITYRHFGEATDSSLAWLIKWGWAAKHRAEKWTGA